MRSMWAHTLVRSNVPYGCFHTFVWSAGSAGRGLLQRFAIPGAQDLLTHERDIGRCQQPGVDAGHWGLVLSGFLFKILVALFDTPFLYLFVGIFRKTFNLKPNQEIEI